MDNFILDSNECSVSRSEEFLEDLQYMATRSERCVSLEVGMPCKVSTEKWKEPLKISLFAGGGVKP